MEVNYNSKHRLMIICEYINTNKYIYLLDQWIDQMNKPTITFGDKNEGSNDGFIIKSDDLDMLFNTVMNDNNQQKEMIELLCNRYFNLMKAHIMKKNNIYKNENTDYTYFIMIYGRFREIVLEELEDHYTNVFKKLVLENEKKIANYLRSLKMEYDLLRENPIQADENLMNFICRPLHENFDSNNKYESNYSSNNDTEVKHYEDESIDKFSDQLKSLIKPKIIPIEDVESYELEPLTNLEKSEWNSLDSSSLNTYIEGLLEEKLKHHINKIGIEGKLPKNQIYSKYGVTPHLDSSANKADEAVNQYDKDLSSTKDHINISQFILISFFMYIKYSGRAFIRDKENTFSTLTQIHQIINSPNSPRKVPEYFIKDLKILIHSYAELTVLSNDKNNKKDRDLVYLIESLLLSRLGLSTLNNFNNFIHHIDDLKYGVEDLVVNGSDFISLLNINALTQEIIITYNHWLNDLELNDSSADYENFFSNNILHLYDFLNLSEDDILPTYDTSSDSSFIKERFRSIQKS